MNWGRNCGRADVWLYATKEGFLLAVLTVSDVWQPDLRREALAVYGTDDPDAHPSVRFLLNKVGAWYVGGESGRIVLAAAFRFSGAASCAFGAAPSLHPERLEQSHWFSEWRALALRPQRDDLPRGTQELAHPSCCSLSWAYDIVEP